MDEIFIYLGYLSRTHFFFHVLYNEKNDYLEMSGQIYHMMIQETMIKENDNIVIWNIVKRNTFVTILNHIRFQQMIYTDDILKNTFIHLLQALREEGMAIKYDGEKYLMYKLDEKKIKYIFNLNIRQEIVKESNDIKIDKIDYITIIKPIDYL